MQSNPIKRTSASTEPSGKLHCVATESKGCVQSSKSHCSQSMQQFEPTNIIRVLLLDQTAACQQHHMAVVRACSCASSDGLVSVCCSNYFIRASKVIPCPPPHSNQLSHQDTRCSLTSSAVQSNHMGACATLQSLSGVQSSAESS